MNDTPASADGAADSESTERPRGGRAASGPPDVPRHRGMVGFLPVFGSVAVWGIAPVFVAVLGKAGFDPYTQTFYRYATAGVFFLAIAAVFDSPGLLAALRAWRRTGAMALTLLVFQLTWVNAVYLTSPTVAGFAGHLSMVFGLAGGALLFADERALVLSWRFLAGAALVAGAAVGVMFGGEVRIEGGPVTGGGGARHDMLGVMCLVVFPAAWAAFSLLIKRFVGYERPPARLSSPKSDTDSRGVPSAGSVAAPASSGQRRGPDRAGLLRPIPAFAVTMAEASLLVLAVAAVFGDLGHVTAVGGKMVLVLVVSGVGCVGVGQALYFISIGRIGAAMSQTAIRATPFLTGLFSFTLLGERMSAFQWACGTVLVVGVVYLVNVRAPGRATACHKGHRG